MSVINILSPHVADLIAAGEVVERPASVVKELVENAIDAGAKNVTVEVRGGGAALIRVRDDGCGMSAEDAGIAFLRHATSKLRDERDLEAIGTMGFRGEALAAISAVSKIRLTTRQKGAESGTLVTLEAGEITAMQPCGCPDGTVMEVRELFYNTPARQKFLKSDRAETTACQAAALRCALAHPEISFRFIRDGEEQFFSPGDGRQDSCLYALLGRAVAADMLKCTGENAGISVSGYVSSPSAGRGSRALQFFFCNGRAIRSQLLQAALEQAYKNSLLTGRYPSCALYLTLSCGSVDVNVHPAKTEVKFSDERAVFDAVYYAVLSALAGEERTKAPSGELPASVKPKEGFYQSMSAADFRAGGYAAAPAPKSPAPAGAKAASGSWKPTGLRAPDMQWQEKLDLRGAPSTPSAPKTLAPTGDSGPAGSRIVEKAVQNVEKPRLPDHKILGEAMKTYILVEQGEELLLIDKHAAHERIIFDRLKAQDREIMAQSLLAPVTLRPSGADAELIEQNASLFASLGFEIEPFGVSEFVVRALPADVDAADVAPAIEEICEKLRRGLAPRPEEARDEILHTVACKAAIKAGWDNSPEELERLVEAVLSGAVKYCPHGRPVSAALTKKELDRLFKRIV
ncbi:MAG: DNA mismatch repair endonuclease MutL [Oscillospiraceae bacterium]|nr:DNA mismatch repair endonuclease MutL [Oscillospiraceae bacterium]